MANSDVGAKQLAMYADNPVRFCNLRGQLEGAAGAASRNADDDLQLRPSPLKQFWLSCVFGGLIGVLLAANEVFRLTTFRIGLIQESFVVLFGLACLALAVLAAWGLINNARLSRREEIYERFNIDPNEYRLVSAAIMGNRGQRLEADGLSVVPHALFQRRGRRNSFHVGLFLNRPYAGKVHDGDLFRLTLHMGVIKRSKKGKMVSGSIRYAGKLVKIAYSESLYTSLKTMREEYRESVRQWWPQNRFSLRQRQRMAAGALVRSREIEWPDQYYN